MWELHYVKELIDFMSLELNNEIESFLMIGQSNMAGRGEFGEVEAIENDNCFMLRMGLWEKMSEPINPDAPIYCEDFHSGISLAASFADELQKQTKKKIGLIPCAFGGTKLEQWMPGELLFDHAVMMTKLAMRSSRLKGIIWHQGESDCSSDENVLEYKTKFLAMISCLKKEIGIEAIPVIMGEVSENITEAWNVGNRPKKINQVFHEISEEMRDCRVVTSKGLYLKSDGIHFDSKSCRIFGQRYCETYLEMQRSKQ